MATALATLAPLPETFRTARDFAAWLGLTPRQHSTGGKQRLGATTRMGERSLRRLLILGASSVVIKRRPNPLAQPGTKLGGLLARKPGMLVRVALANNPLTHARMCCRAVDGADRLGLDGPGRRLQGFGRGGLRPSGVRERRSGRGQGAVWRSSRETASEDPVRNRVPSSTQL